jgi:hypothetical protein
MDWEQIADKWAVMTRRLCNDRTFDQLRSDRPVDQGRKLPGAGQVLSQAASSPGPGQTETDINQSQPR